MTLLIESQIFKLLLELKEDYVSKMTDKKLGDFSKALARIGVTKDGLEHAFYKYNTESPKTAFFPEMDVIKTFLPLSGHAQSKIPDCIKCDNSGLLEAKLIKKHPLIKGVTVDEQKYYAFKCDCDHARQISPLINRWHNSLREFYEPVYDRYNS